MRLLLVTAVALLFVATPGSAQTTNMKQILLEGSPWRVLFQWGGFTQTFAQTPDGKVKTTSDEVGHYETEVQFPTESQAVWINPHRRTIDVFVHQGRVVGTSRDGEIILQYETRRR